MVAVQRPFVQTEILALVPVLHPEDSELGFLHRSVERRAQAQPQHFPTVGWIDHPWCEFKGT